MRNKVGTALLSNSLPTDWKYLWSEILQYLIGIVPPTAYAQRIAAFQRRWPTNETPGTVEPHITVKAQGGLTPSQLEEMGREATGFLRPFPTFEVTNVRIYREVNNRYEPFRVVPLV